MQRTHLHSDSDQRIRRQKLTLIVGFGALLGALVLAHRSPTRGYELSIYQGTPAGVWVGLGLALLASLVVVFSPPRSRLVRSGALVLAVAAGWSFVAVPLVRGYYFYGVGDSLSHLGFARSFASGAMSPFDLLHPGVHLSSIMVGSAVGISLERALVLTVFLTVGAFFVFVPLCVRAVTDADGAGTVAVFTALLLVPINGVATHIIAHPTSQTLLIIPLVLFVLLLYLREALGRWWTPSPLGVVLALASVTVVLYHPQEAMSVIIVFWTVALMGFLYRLWSPRHPIATHRSIYVQAAFLTGLFLLWAPRHSRTQSRIVTAYQSIVGVRSPPGVEAAQRAGSVAAIGGSFVELALKLFLVSFVLSLLAGGLMALSLSGRLDDVLPERNAAVRYLTVAFVPLAALTAFVFVGNFGDHYLRFAGFLMVIVTLLSAVALGDVIPALVSRGRLPALRRATLVLFVLLLPLALVSVHPSPWIYQPSQQVTEQTMVGYELAFETRDPDVPFVAIRGSTERFVDAIYGPESATAASFPGARASVPPPVFNTNLTTAYDGARYFPVTDSDRARELQLYAGFRYSSTGFSTLDTSPRSDRVIDTDGFQLYVLTDDDRS